PAASHAPRSSSIPGVDTAISEDAPKATTFTGACVESVAKRLRAFRKKLTKIERTETQAPAELNKDQLEAIQKKPEVVAVARELDEIVKQLAAAEPEEVRDQKRRDAAHHAETAKAVKAATDEARYEHRRNMKRTLGYIHALERVLPRVPTLPVDVSEAQFAALSRMQTMVCGTREGTIDDVFITAATSTLELLLAGSDAVFHEGITYAELAALLDVMLSPPAPPRFGHVEGGEVGDLASAAGPAMSEPETAASYIGSQPASLFSSTGITFLTPSELENEKVLAAMTGHPVPLGF
ncbi:hypothetical protein HK101_004434, partial [Irineochytrium annulatum]